MEKPLLPNQHQCPNRATDELTCAREPVTPKSGTDLTPPAPSGTHDAGNEATTEPAPMASLHTGPATGTGNGSRRRSSALLTGVITATTLRSPFRTTPAAFPTAMEPITTKKPRVNDHHVRPRAIGRRRSRAGPPKPTGAG